MENCVNELIKTDKDHRHLTAAKFKCVYKRGHPSADDHGRFELASVQLAH